MKSGALVYVEAQGFSLARDIDLVDALLSEHRPDVLVLDSFRSLTPGVEENDSAATEEVLGLLRTRARRYECAVLLLHHAGKDGGSYRGSTGIGAAVELGFSLSRHEDDPERRTRRRLVNWKCRPAAEAPARWLSLTADAGRVLIGEAEPFAGAEAPTSREELTATAFAMALAERGRLTWAELCTAAGVSPGDGTAKRARERALREGRIAQVERGIYAAPTGAGS